MSRSIRQRRRHQSRHPVVPPTVLAVAQLLGRGREALDDLLRGESDHRRSLGGFAHRKCAGAEEHRIVAARVNRFLDETDVPQLRRLAGIRVDEDGGPQIKGAASRFVPLRIALADLVVGVLERPLHRLAVGLSPGKPIGVGAFRHRELRRDHDDGRGAGRRFGLGRRRIVRIVRIHHLRRIRGLLVRRPVAAHSPRSIEPAKRFASGSRTTSTARGGGGAVASVTTSTAAVIAMHTATPPATAMPTIIGVLSFFRCFLFFRGRGVSSSSSSSSSSSTLRDRTAGFDAVGRGRAVGLSARTAADVCGRGFSAGVAGVTATARVGSLQRGQRIRLPATSSLTCMSAEQAEQRIRIVGLRSTS